jgi:hypothetical protein
VAEYRASFDATIRFSNGGDLTAHGFRVDVPSADVSQAEIAALFVASLGLLMTDTVELDHVEVFAEPHKGTRGGPSDRGAGRSAPGAAGRLVELNHVIRDGMTTYPGLPGPAIASHLTHRRWQPTRAHAAARGRHSRRRAPDRPRATAAGRRPVHGRPAAHRGIRHHPGARVRPAAGVTA